MADSDSERVKAEGIGRTGDQTRPVPPSRPLGITIVSLLYALWGFGSIATSIQSFLGGNYTYQFYYGFVLVVLSWGVWKGKGWAWSLIIIEGIAGLLLLALSPLVVSAYTATTSVPEYLTVSFYVIGFLLNVLFLLYATRRSTKAYFGKESVRKDFF